jgi:cytochrome oxidase Cu insertion factor (SCO1/SenC/PrrC family)
LHSDYFVLIDGDGLIRGYYESSDAARVKALLADVKTLLR